ncbi:unnamed protein product [Symbiodinium microadriaticum]|nr:unnamed protein product [Symbiodinium microadriaticum]
MDTGCLQLIRDGDGVNSIVIAKYRLDSKVKAQSAGPASFNHLTTEADANTPSSGIFWNPSQTVEHACLNFGAMLSELFLISKAMANASVGDFEEVGSAGVSGDASMLPGDVDEDVLGLYAGASTRVPPRSLSQIFVVYTRWATLWRVCDVGGIPV